MQSSSAVVLRALVMLACLVMIPLAALCGSSLPKFVTTVLDGRWPECLSSLSPEHSAPSEAPQFEPMVPNAVASTGPVEQAVPELPRDPPRSPEPSPPTVTPAVYDAPLGSAGGGRMAGGVVAANRSASRDAASDAPSARNDLASILPLPARGPRDPATASQDTHPQAAALRTGDPAAQASPAPDQFTLIQERLRKLGATYYLLESWGSQQDLFRFYCKMAIGGNPNYTRHFEATHSEPIRAMALVLQQVEAWRASRE